MGHRGEGARSATHVVVVGGGFAGVGCAKRLAQHGVRVTLLDRNNYHQFQPLLYQVATAAIAPSDVARPLRGIFKDDDGVLVKQVDVVSVDPVARSVTTAEGEVFQGDHLVLAAGAQPRFFHTPGAPEHAFPLYSVTDAERLRTHVLEAFEAADRDTSLLDHGALEFVVIGGGATGVETAGALAELAHKVMPARYHDLPANVARVHLVDHGHCVLAPFSEHAQQYAADILQKRGVVLHLGVGAKEVAPGQVTLSDDTVLRTRTVVWAGGMKAASLAEACGLPTGRGGRIEAQEDLSVDGFPGVWAVGDVANIPDRDGGAYPQLGSVALQSGRWAAENIVREVDGHGPKPFKYVDKGIMAMIGRNAAVAEMGAHRHEIHGTIAFASWLGVHAWLMSGVRNRVDAFISWGWDYVSDSRPEALIDDPDAPAIDWGDDADDDQTAPDPGPTKEEQPSHG